MEIKRLRWDSPEALACIGSATPVVLIECPICYPAMTSWTYERVSQIMKPDFQCDVYSSYTHRFTYSDEKKNTGFYENRKAVTKKTMTFGEFYKYIKAHKTTSSSQSYANLYLQQALVAEMGPLILEEYTKFSLATALQLKQIGGWDALTNNLLLCGKEGFITPVHFDEQENLFAQLNGRKRVRLFHPHNWRALYPYPLGHPCDRQAQVVLPSTPGSCVLADQNDRTRFPAFSELGASLEGTKELYVDLSPGEVLYIPQYWFHQMEGLTDNISLSWWFTHNTKRGLDFANIELKDISLVAVRRNLEKLISEMAGSGITKIPPWPLPKNGAPLPLPPCLPSYGDGDGERPRKQIRWLLNSLPPPRKERTPAPTPEPSPTQQQDASSSALVLTSSSSSSFSSSSASSALTSPAGSDGSGILTKKGASNNYTNNNGNPANSVSLLVEANYSEQFRFPATDLLRVDAIKGRKALQMSVAASKKMSFVEGARRRTSNPNDTSAIETDGAGGAASSSSSSVSVASVDSDMPELEGEISLSEEQLAEREIELKREERERIEREREEREIAREREKESSGLSSSPTRSSRPAPTPPSPLAEPAPSFAPSPLPGHLLPSEAEDLHLWDSIVHQSLTFISLILKPEDARGFLLQLVSGRFSAFSNSFE